MTEQPMDLEAMLIAKVVTDESFKHELMSNPKAVIAKEFGVECPEEIEIEVLEQTPKKLYLVLPMKPDAEAVNPELSNDLSDEELELVAGGVIGYFRQRGTIVKVGMVCWW